MINHPAPKAHNSSVGGPRKLKFGYDLHEGERSSKERDQISGNSIFIQAKSI